MHDRLRIGDYAQKLGFDDSRGISQPLIDFWSEDLRPSNFLHASDEVLKAIASSFVKKYGRKYWGVKGRKPEYPECRQEIQDNIIGILKVQRRNQGDIDKKRRRRRAKSKQTDSIETIEIPDDDVGSEHDIDDRDSDSDFMPTDSQSLQPQASPRQIRDSIDTIGGEIVNFPATEAAECVPIIESSFVFVVDNAGSIVKTRKRLFSEMEGSSALPHLSNKRIAKDIGPSDSPFIRSVSVPISGFVKPRQMNMSNVPSKSGSTADSNDEAEQIATCTTRFSYSAIQFWDIKPDLQVRNDQGESSKPTQTVSTDISEVQLEADVEKLFTFEIFDDVYEYDLSEPKLFMTQTATFLGLIERDEFEAKWTRRNVRATPSEKQEAEKVLAILSNVIRKFKEQHQGNLRK